MDIFFLWKRVRRDTALLPVSTCLFPETMKGVLDVMGRQLVQLFHYIATGELLLFPLGSRKCDISHLLFTPRASAVTKKSTIQPMRNQEKVKSDSDKSGSTGKMVKSRKRKL